MNNKMRIKFNILYRDEIIENEIYKMFFLFAIPFQLIVTIANYLTNLGILATINTLILFIISCIEYYLALKKKIYLNLFACTVYLIYITIQWFVNGGGSHGGMNYFFVQVLVMIMIFLKGPKRIILLVITFITIITLLLYEYYDGRYIVQYIDEFTRLIDIIMSIIIGFFTIAIIIRLLLNKLDFERNKADELLKNILPLKIIKD
ncbi:MAG: hypothetical protein E4G94_06560, partial [ANME-2 cluster archaeon]